ncbi:MAG: MFS transporter [Petrotogales bacterium]
MKRRLPLLITALLRFTAVLSFGMLLQLRLRELGASVFIISLLTTVRGGVMTFGSPIWGALADEKQYRKSLLIFLVSFPGLLYLLYAFLQVPYHFILIAGAIAFFSSGFRPVVLAVSTVSVGNSVSKSSREISFINAASSLGMFLGRMLVSLLLIILSVQNTLLLFALLVFAAAAPSLRIKETKRTDVRDRYGNLLHRIFPITVDPTPLKQNGLWAVYLGSFMRQLGIAGIMSIIAIYMTESVGLSESLAVLLSGINPALQFFSHLLFGRLISHIGPKISTVIGIFLSTMTAVFLSLANGWIMIALAYGCLGLAFGAFINGASTFITLNSPNERRAEFLGLLRSSRSMGFMVGPITAGLIAESTFTGMFAFMATVMAISGLIVVIFSKEDRSHVNERFKS